MRRIVDRNTAHGRATPSPGLAAFPSIYTTPPAVDDRPSTSLAQECGENPASGEVRAAVPERPIRLAGALGQQPGPAHPAQAVAKAFLDIVPRRVPKIVTRLAAVNAHVLAHEPQAAFVRFFRRQNRLD